MNILDFYTKKNNNEKISCVTCYDYSAAKLIELSTIDCVLVGDSVAMVVHGHKNTTYATMDMMRLHTEAVARGIESKFIIADLPFLSYQGDIDKTIENVKSLMQAGAHAIKLEGVSGNLETIKVLTDAGIPIMGHIGLTPQSIHQLGGHKVQGRTTAAEEKLLQDALDLETSGCFAVVLECIPKNLAKKITKSLTIATIGIGAGSDTDGQILVWHDLLGYDKSFKPKFLKQFLDTEVQTLNAINTYSLEVKDRRFPNQELHTY